MKKYTIGIDLGTTSIGYALIDNEFKLIKKGGKNLWGSVLFKEAESAQSTRQFRSARRLKKRRRIRIKLLRDLMSSMISDVDSLFFKKLDLSYMDDEDKFNEFGIHSKLLWNGISADLQYNKEFKTIYHLRSKIINSKAKMDPRLIYLALHHIIKYRGNFLYEGKTFNVKDNSSILDHSRSISEALSMRFSESINENDIAEIMSIANDSKISNSDKKTQVKTKFKGINKNPYSEILNALLGGKIVLNNLLNLDGKSVSISFKNKDIDEVLLEDLSCVDEDGITVLTELHELHNLVVLKKIVGDDTDKCYSDIMIETYNRHKSNLKLLKRLIKENCDSKVYKDIFNGKLGETNYITYIKSPSKLLDKKTGENKFFKELKRIVETFPESEDKEIILTALIEEDFLPKLNSKRNSLIPYQLQLHELRLILGNQGQYYPELLQNKDKIESLLTFRIPYYVGPLSAKSGRFAWIEKLKEDIKILPWNFDEVVDIPKTAQKFIDRMKNHCTYLLGEDVLPKNSLILSEFELLNELNKIKINGNSLGFDVKHSVIDNLFKVKKNVSQKDLEKYLIDNQFFTEINEITGMQKDQAFASSLNSYIDFVGFCPEIEKNYEAIEKIIEWLTVYNEAKIIRSRIEEEYQSFKPMIENILKLKYSGYGRLSRKLIDGLVGKDSKKNPKTIIEIMRESNHNFMEIIKNKKFEFDGLIDDSNDLSGGIKYSDIAALAGSPALKRGIWKTIKTVEDIVDYMGCPPERICIEFARSEEKKKRTLSRSNAIKAIFENIVNNNMKIDGKVIESKDPIFSKLDETELKNEAMYLYVTQHGKCMYTGAPLDPNLLMTYEIDHIIPRAYITDNSLCNKVLVKKIENQTKGDNLLISESVITKQSRFWKSLLDCQLISNKKYTNLCRTTLTDDDKVRFINRQLVETRQISKHVANFLKIMFDCDVISVKAASTTEFRKKFDFYKLRGLNDVHHTHDAYFAALIGSFTVLKYPFFKSEMALNSYNKLSAQIIERIKSKANYGFIIDQLNDKTHFNQETGEVIWKGSESINYVKKILKYKDPIISYKTHEGKGGLYNATILSPKEFEKSKDKHKNIATKKNRNIDKYGGYKSLATAYLMIVSYASGKKQIKEVINIPLIVSQSKELKDDYIKYVIKSSDYSVIVDKVDLGQMFEYKGCRYRLVSERERKIAEQIFIDSKFHKLYSEVLRGKIDYETNEKHIELLKEILAVGKRKIPEISDDVDRIENLMPKICMYEINNLNSLIINVVSGMNGNSKTIKIGNEPEGKISEFGRIRRKSETEECTFIYDSPSGIRRKRLKR